MKRIFSNSCIANNWTIHGSTMNRICTNRYSSLIKQLRGRKHANIKAISDNFVIFFVETCTMIGSVNFGDKSVMKWDNYNRRLFNSTLVLVYLNFHLLIYFFNWPAVSFKNYSLQTMQQTKSWIEFATKQGIGSKTLSFHRIKTRVLSQVQRIH